MEKIPTRIIGLLSQVYSVRYTQAEVDSLFLYAGAPEDVPLGSKSTKIQEWLRAINKQSEEPLKVLGVILEDFMERSKPRTAPWDSVGHENWQGIDEDQQKIRETLAADGISYLRGGELCTPGATPTHSLLEITTKNGLATVEIEIQRAISRVEDDPHAAVHYAGNVLEAALKAYLDSKGREYGGSDGLAELWRLAAEQIGLRPAEWDSKDLKKIASGLNSIVDGVAHLRNNKSGAHGKSEEQARSFIVKPRHARLAIHAAHSVAAYVLELID